MKNEPLKLDFSAIRGDTESRQEASQDGTKSGEGLLYSDHGNAVQNAATSPTEGNEGAEWMAKMYAQEQADHERAAGVYREYQENIRRAGHIRTELLKGAESGEPLDGLLLKAARCISLMTADDLFYRLIKRELEARGFTDPE